MSSSYELTSLHSITLSSCSVSAAALLGDINIQLQKLSNQIKFLLQFIPMTFGGGGAKGVGVDDCFRAEPECNCFNNLKGK